MPDGFSELVNIYIENLNLPYDTKVKLIASNPKTLADVSLWLEENREQEIRSNPFNPFVTTTKNQIANKIKLFSNNSNTISQNSNLIFNRDSLVDTDDASWGLGIEKTSASADTSAVSYYSNTAATNKTSNTKTQSAPAATTSTKTKEAQDNAIASIKENVNSSVEVIMKQMEEQGNISKAYNSIKEYFDAEMALSSVCRTIFAENTTAELLQRAQDGNLTKEEYWNTKIDTVIDMLTAGRELSDEERTCLEERFAQYTPEELNQLIDKLKCTNSEEYSMLTAQVDRLIEEGRNLLSSSRSDSNSVNLSENPNSIKSLLKSGAGKEIMTFNEVWKAERGVDFDPEAITEYEKSAAEYAMVTMVNNKANALHDLLKDSMSLVKGNNENGVSPQVREAGEKQLEVKLLTALKELYGDNEEKINQKLQEISNGSISYKDGNIVYNEYSKNNKGYALLNSAQKLLDGVDANVQKIQGPYSESYYKNKMASAYEMAYGRKNATQLAQAFANDQETIVGKVRTGVEITGAGVMVAGMFFCPPAALAGALTASFGGIGVEAYNEATRSTGMTDEAKKKITEELMTNAALFAVGGAAGKMGSAAKAALLAEKCPTLMACIADLGIDATISLLGDMALSGEIDIAGEGLSQLMSILAGHVKAGKFGKTAISRQDLNPGKNPVGNHALEDLKRTDPQVYEDYKLLRSKNMLPSNFGNLLINAKDAKLNENLKKDISLLADCVRKGIDPKDAFVPKMKSLEEAAKTKKPGEVFSLEGTNDVYIMDDSGPVKLDMDRDMYYSLFPPVASYCTNQGSMGDCYFVSAILDGAMNNPKAKVEMLKMFHQQGNDLVFEFKNYSSVKGFKPNMTYDNCPSQIVFKNAKKRLSTVSNAGISGATGLKLAEEAYGYKLAATQMAEFMSDTQVPRDKQRQVFEELQKVFEDDNYKPSKEFLDILAKTFEHSGQYSVNQNSASLKSKIMIALDGIDAVRQKSIGNGGDPATNIRNFFGLDSSATQTLYASDDESIIKFLKQFDNNPNVIFTTATDANNLKITSYAEQFAVFFGLGEKGGHTLIGQHAYRIHSYDLENKTISVVNPWDTTKIVTLTFDQFKKYFPEISATDISKVQKTEISEALVNKMQELGIPTQTAYGRNYSNDELIDLYIKKLQDEKNLAPARYRSIDADDYINEDIYNNKNVVALHNKLVEKYGNTTAETVMKAISNLGDRVIFDENKLNAIVKNIDNLLNDKDINFDLAYKIVSTLHSNYEFVMEKAGDIIKQLKAKGYTDSAIVKIINNITKENYDEMKKLWE